MVPVIAGRFAKMTYACLQRDAAIPAVGHVGALRRSVLRRKAFVGNVDPMVFALLVKSVIQIHGVAKHRAPVANVLRITTVRVARVGAIAFRVNA